LEEIACVEKQIISPTSSKTVIGIVQDGLLGAYNLTDPKLKIDWRSAMNIMSYTSMESFKKFKKGKSYTGSELYSLILPQGINISKGSFKIKNGQLLEGRLSKDMLGAKKKNNLIQLIWDGYGVEETKKFIDNTQRLINNFNLWHGFSVGIGDIVVPDSVHKQVEIKFQTKQLEVEKLITELENNPDIMPPEIFEHKVFSTLNTIRDDASQLVVENLTPNNSFGIMAWSGSKGDKTNMGQMVACLGLQAFEGKLIPKKYNNRTFAYYFQNDDRAVSRGLVRQSFIRGLEFPEYAAHLMASRLGIIEQAIKSVTGDTPIIIQENGETRRVLIGDWIDEHMKNNSDKIQHEPQKQMELLNIDHNITIPTTDSKGNVSWEKVTVLTRHDHDNELYEFKTCSGRKVNVVQSKSLLIWDNINEKFVETLTKNIKIGDCVPVNMNLTQPPVILSYINTSKYLHGTDINNAKSDNMLISERFELTKENGTFIGFLLSGGNIDLLAGSVNITNYDIVTKKFVQSWFDKFHITWKEYDYTNEINERTVTTQGYSAILAKLLTNIVGHDARHKYVPNEAFSASDEFVIGLLDGYFSGNSTITENSIQVESESPRLIEGINMLCSRLGIFGNVTVTKMNQNNNLLTIGSKWASLFAKKIQLTDIAKAELIKIMKCSEEHVNFDSYNDVVLDPIVSIERIDHTKYKKVYDLTIPSTLNFGLANGLQVRDTSETGYVQRKLIKSMEDIMIKYDGTVRSANDRLIQIVYGDSGTNTTKQCEYAMKLMEYNNEDVRKKCVFTKDELKLIKGFSEEQNEKLFNEIISQRDNVRRSVRNSKMNFIQEITNFMLPVNLNRIIDNIAGTNTKGEELKATYIVDEINRILLNENTTMIYMSADDRANPKSFKRRDEIAHKQVFKLALFDAINPKRMMLELKLNKTQFDEIVAEIINSFNKNMIEPGEQAGIIAAQSTGEPFKSVD